MPLRQGLSVYCYRLPVMGTSLIITNYTSLIEGLSIETNNPGGFGQLTCRVHVPNVRLVPPELQTFSRIAVVSGIDTIYLGRLEEPNVARDGGDGDYIDLTAQGAGIELRDDPGDSSYTAQTAQYIIGQEFTARTWMVMDQSMTKVLPDNPVATFSPGFSGKSIEDILNDSTFYALGQYDWQVWEHPTNLDNASQHKPQLYWTARDTTTVHYMAFLPDQNAVNIRPSSEYSYNAVTLNYKDATSGLPSSVTVTDSRLGAGHTQGNAPFPFRRIRKDISSASLSSTQATTLANSLLNTYKNGGYKVEVKLNNVRNGSGAPIALWAVRAGKNIYLPEFAPIGNQLGTTPIYLTNLFTIIDTSYNDDAQELTIHAANFDDTEQYQIARLQYLAEQANKNGKTAGVVQSAGVPEIGTCAVSAPSSATAGQIYEVGVNFKALMTTQPTSITLTADLSTNNSIAAVNVKATGFTLQLTVTANGAADWRGYYKTNGN